MAGLEIVSVGSVMPFLQVASDPDSVHEADYLNWVYVTFEFSNTNTFLVYLGLLSLAALIISNTFIVITSWALYRYVWRRNHSLSRRLLYSYLKRPYQFFLSRNSSELSKNVLEEVKEITDQMLRPALRGFAKGLVAVSIIGFLVYVDTVMATIVSVVLAGSYSLIYFAVRERLDHAGQERVKSNTNRYQFVSEAFQAVKEVKLRGKEEDFLRRYSGSSERYAKYQALYRVIKQSPRYILEAVAFGGIILIAVYLIAVEENIRQVVPTLGLYAFAGYRLMPALQQAFKGLASARFNIAALEKVDRDLKHVTRAELFSTDAESTEAGKPLELNGQLVLNDITYTYPDKNDPAISNLSIEIESYSTVGFVGKTGSGKTTTVDLILGLLRPQKGSILIDETPLQDSNIKRWQQQIGYVPQQICLSDDTVARNIAFGVPEKEINLDAVRDAARRAHIYDLVCNKLPDQWETVIGERGVKLSGGQRQRIGIARALYHNPSVLVFDEATSALDQSTEASVMEAIYDLEGDHTILMVAHRLSTVQGADNIFMLEDGRKIGEGTYEELKKGNSKFRSMALS